MIPFRRHERRQVGNMDSVDARIENLRLVEARKIGQLRELHWFKKHWRKEIETEQRELEIIREEIRVLEKQK